MIYISCSIFAYDDIRLEDSFQVTGRLFNQSSESIPRRSARLSRDTPINSNSNMPQFGGNGTDHSSGKLRVNSSTSSKLCSTERSVQVRKGKPRATENFDEGDYRFNVNDPSNCINVLKCGRYVVMYLCNWDVSAYFIYIFLFMSLNW
jgi:hypothetical protein